MYQEITQSDFTAEFHRANRGSQFSHAALLALYDYLEEINPDTELDVVGICCDFSEYSNAVEAAANYGFELDADATEEQNEDAAKDFLRRKTSVIEFDGDGGIVIANC
jgi:polysaccharide pyruvyl transferase WcaK-like protein